MSSIFGKCNSGDRPLARTEIEGMQGVLNYWSPDDENIWIGETVGLGCLMMYNTPESLNERLPLYNNDYRLCITADARIDNRDELYPLLQINTPEEKLLPDGNILLLLYKKFGQDCVKHLIGDFAFAIWDEQQRTLFCARDQMGVKPFFYYYDDKFFAFATEKKGILSLPGTDHTIDKDFLCNQLFAPVIQAGDTTIYKNIRRLPPAHTLTFDPAKKEYNINSYWTLDPYKEMKLGRRDEYYEGLRFHFENAVKCRLRTRFPIGVELSGGIDSSSITGVASHFLKDEGKNIITFTNTLDETDHKNNSEIIENDRRYAKSAIEFNRINESVWITKNIWDDLIEEIEFAMRINDGLEMRSELWLLAIKKAAMERNVRTLLSGFPGDEMVTYRGQLYLLDFLGQGQYLKYFRAKTQWPYNKLKPFLSPGTEFLFHKLKNRLAFRSKQIKDFFEFFKLPGSCRFSNGDVVWKDIEYRERFKSYRHYQKYRLLKPQVPLRMEGENRFGLSFKTETRYPMADIRLTEFYLAMPNEIKYEGPLERSAFRKAVQNYLPESILQRNNKLGHIAPFRKANKEITNHNEILMKIINGDENLVAFNNIGRFKPSESTHIRTESIELFVWFKKNFENM